MNTDKTRRMTVRKPRVRVIEKGDAFILDAEMPGIAETEVELTVEKGSLKLEAGSDADGVRYERFFQLPKSVDAGNLSAKMSKGILSITLPKAKELQPRTIKVLAS